MGLDFKRRLHCRVGERLVRHGSGKETKTRYIHCKLFMSFVSAVFSEALLILIVSNVMNVKW